LIQRIEANAANPDAGRSGLGLLTLMSDYGARLAWIFSSADENDRICLETYASIPISQTHN
ncbi:MAG: ATP-binding protein, partial [Mesorhizobium sp.]